MTGVLLMLALSAFLAGFGVYSSWRKHTVDACLCAVGAVGLVYLLVTGGQA